MSLHRSESVADWQRLDPSQWNSAQVVANATGGIVTPGNLVSATGLILVTAGLNDIANGRVAKGTVELWAGRMADMADGLTAHMTGTKSPLGEVVDAGLDKAEMAATLAVLYRAGVVPRSAALAIAGQQVSSGLLSATASLRGDRLHPSLEGKRTAALQWLAIGGYCVSHALRDSRPEAAQNMEMAAAGLTAGATALGAVAVIDYGRDMLNN